jgi:hypothetical protein
MPGQAAGSSPGFIAPMLATAAAGLPQDAAEFVAEVKWDGLRACIAVASGQVRAWSRTGRDITAATPSSARSRPRPGAQPWSWTVRSSPCPVTARAAGSCGAVITARAAEMKSLTAARTGSNTRTCHRT